MTHVDELTLLVDGREYTGWERLRVVRQLEAASGTFRVEGSHRVPWPLLPGAEVQVIAANDLREDVMLTGFIDDLDAKGQANKRSIVVGGRDKTADLVDCSETSEPGEFSNIIIQDLLSAIAEPFGIDVNSSAQRFGQEPFEVFKIQPGETAWSAIERAARMRALLVFSEGDGSLRLAKPGADFSNVDLVEGLNITEWALKVSRRQRFAEYIVRGQAPGSDDGWGATVAQIEGRATDPIVSRFRPLVVIAEGTVTFDSAADRAQWEATFRAARASTIDVRIPSWRTSDTASDLWKINQEVRVRIPSEQVDSNMLIREVAYTRDAQAGNMCTLNLTRPDAYIPAPVVPMDEEPFGDLLEGETVDGLTSDGLDNQGL